MTRKLKKSDFRPAAERIGKLPEKRQRAIKLGAYQILKGLHLAEVRKAVEMTQTQLSEKAGVAQSEISRVENNPASVHLQTLERYAEGLGGELSLVMSFPDGTRAEMPVKHGRLVKSRVEVVHENENEKESEIRTDRPSVHA